METDHDIGQSNIIFKNLEERLCTEEINHFFGLSNEEITDLLKSLQFINGRISPMFLSPGYGDNDTENPQIRIPLLGASNETLFHEIKHALHYQLCCVIFKREELRDTAFSLFCENILGDEEFVKEIEKKGTNLQKKFIQHAMALNAEKDKTEQLPANISDSAKILGALTYQHAYFVDSRMCEAVASYNDNKTTKIIGKINSIVASIFPYPTFHLKGYGDKNSQNMFKQADPLRKALLVKRRDYDRNKFFQQPD